MAELLLRTGAVDWSGGVDSIKVPTIQSPNNPNGLASNQLAWLNNATMREGCLAPRDGYTKKGSINSNLPPQVIPGTPGQTIPQPPTPPVQTPYDQVFRYPSSTFNVPVVGASITIPTTNSASPNYIGNVGDILLAQYKNSPFGPVNTLGTFIVLAFTGTTLTLQTQPGSANAGSAVNVDDGFGVGAITYYIQALGPAVPQPPIIIPPGPPTVLPAQPLWQGEVNPLYSPNGPDSFSAAGTPYGICVIGGHVVAFDPDFNQPPLDLSVKFNLFLSATAARAFFCQAEQYLIIQAGDYNSVTNTGTLPLFWDGFNLTRSNGITGILARGAPFAATLNITTTTAWIPPATGAVSSVIQLAAPYPGNLGDNLSIATAAAPSTVIGIFRVTTIGAGSTSIILTSAETNSSALQAAGPLLCTYCGPGSNTTYPYTAPSNVIIGNGFWNVPAVGAQGPMDTTSLYFGSVGDTIRLQSIDSSVTYGTFTVVSFTTTQMVLKTLAGSAYAGKQVTEGSFLVTATACRTFTENMQPNAAEGLGGPFIIPAVGQSARLFGWPAFDGTYTGYVNDNVNLIEKSTGVLLGQFRITAKGNQLSSSGHSFPYITLQTIVTSFSGNSYHDVLTTTVIVPPNSPQIMTLNSGQWTIPVVGQSVSLQIIWGGALGPAYPGNVGDNITLSNIAPVQTFGTFVVTAFDTLGNITLKCVATTVPGTVIVGPTSAVLVINSVPSTTGFNINQIPAATLMVYYQGIVWYAQGNIISGGDIVGGPSGTSTNNYIDSVLCVTENPLALGGDGFKLPIPGAITGMAWPQQIDASLGQGLLIVGTINGLCSLQVPTNRGAWISANSNNLPQINVVQFNNGFVNDMSIVSVNGDLYFQSLEPGIRSMIMATRYFGQWGNVMIASNENRVFKFVNRALLPFASGIYFNNRLLETTLPMQTVYGVVHQAIIPLDMTPISTLEEQLPPNWEGINEGLQVFQLCTGYFTGVQRSFAVTLSQNENTPGEIDLWELVQGSYFDNGSTPIVWQAEFPAFTCAKEFDLKKLAGAQLWVDGIRGVVSFKMEYRPDSASCWTLWHEWKVCSATTSATDTRDPVPYPVTPLPPGFRQVMTLPKPQQKAQSETGRPTIEGYQFQPRLTVTGSCRLRGMVLMMEKMDNPPYDQLV